MRHGTEGTAGTKQLGNRKYLKEVRGFKAGLGPVGTTIEKDVVDVFDRLQISGDAHWSERKMGQLAKNVLIRKDILTAQRLAEEPLMVFSASSGSRGKIRFSTLVPMQSVNCVTPVSTEDQNAAAQVIRGVTVAFNNKSRSSSASKDCYGDTAIPVTPVSKISALNAQLNSRTQPGRAEAAV